MTMMTGLMGAYIFAVATGLTFLPTMSPLFLVFLVTLVTLRLRSGSNKPSLFIADKKKAYLTNLYPILCTVMMRFGSLGSSSSFSRMFQIWVSTVRVVTSSLQMSARIV